jgi:hypothetical protein
MDRLQSRDISGRLACYGTAKFSSYLTDVKPIMPEISPFLL